MFPWFTIPFNYGCVPAQEPNISQKHSPTSNLFWKSANSDPLVLNRSRQINKCTRLWQTPSLPDISCITRKRWWSYGIARNGVRIDHMAQYLRHAYSSIDVSQNLLMKEFTPSLLSEFNAYFKSHGNLVSVLKEQPSLFYASGPLMNELKLLHQDSIHSINQFKLGLEQIVAGSIHNSQSFVCCRYPNVVSLLSMDWDQPKSTLIDGVQLNEGSISHLAFNPHLHQELAVLCDQGKVLVWDLNQTNQEKWCYKAKDLVKDEQKSFLSCCYSSHIYTLYCHNSQSLFALDTRFQRFAKELDVDCTGIQKICSNADYPFRVAASTGKCVKLFDMRYPKEPLINWNLLLEEDVFFMEMISNQNEVDILVSTKHSAEMMLLPAKETSLSVQYLPKQPLRHVYETSGYHQDLTSSIPETAKPTLLRNQVDVWYEWPPLMGIGGIHLDSFQLYQLSYDGSLYMQNYSKERHEFVVDEPFQTNDELSSKTLFEEYLSNSDVSTSDIEEMLIQDEIKLITVPATSHRELTGYAITINPPPPFSEEMSFKSREIRDLQAAWKVLSTQLNYQQQQNSKTTIDCSKMEALMQNNLESFLFDELMRNGQSHPLKYNRRGAPIFPLLRPAVGLIDRISREVAAPNYETYQLPLISFESFSVVECNQESVEDWLHEKFKLEHESIDWLVDEMELATKLFYEDYKDNPIEEDCTEFHVAMLPEPITLTSEATELLNRWNNPDDYYTTRTTRRRSRSSSRFSRSSVTRRKQEYQEALNDLSQKRLEEYLNSQVDNLESQLPSVSQLKTVSRSSQGKRQVDEWEDTQQSFESSHRPGRHSLSSQQPAKKKKAKAGFK